ncbi:MAG TPA: Rieske 2Fe-2S domain-containing protein [Acidimicrobiales bacterium]|nr:Rieske 2Fe-2S domain-containing protein [Acidimicrobiales bacterium]
MVTVEQNERWTRVGPGTPGGELLRRYWQPFLPVAKLDENPVQPVRLLGEDLVCYRDRSGTVGLVGERCAHRLVNMAFGIPEAHGLRCPYHGWCYDETGQCVETPLESPNSRLHDSVSIGGYPVEEMGGLLFAYLGPGEPPVLPPWDVLVHPRALRQIGLTVIPCNWLQCQENASDPVHSVYLHGHFFKYVLERDGLLEERAADPTTHRSHTSIAQGIGYDRVISRLDEHGVQKAMVYTPERGAKEYEERWHSYMIFPNIARVGGGGLRFEMQFRVPVDDTHTNHIVYDIYVVPDGVDVEIPATPPCYEIPIFDAEGKPILDYVLAQDMAAWWSQGEIVDRSKEQVAATDEAVLHFRRLLDDQISLVAAGGDPMNVYRDAAEVGEVIEGHPRVGDAGYRGMRMGAYRSMFHKGYWRDDADRHGPLLEQVKALMQQAEEAAAQRVEQAAPAPVS